MTKSSADSPLDGLVDLACREGVEIRPTLLRVLTDLYVQKHPHSAEEEAQYVELSLRLIEAVDAPTRSAVSATLSAYANAPVAVLRRLIELATAPDARTLPAAKPNTIEVGGAIAEPAREPDLVELFFAASARERRLILTNLEPVGQPVPRRAAPAASEVIRRLEAAALQRNPGEFARILERALGIGRSIAERVTRDNSGEPLVVAAKALGMPAVVLQRVMLFLNPAIGQSVERVFELADLYDDIRPAAAERMVAIWQQAAATRRPAQESAHAPVHWDDEQRGARAAATPSRHGVAPRRDEQSSRFKTNGG
jgi:hypothetical protein